MKWFPLACLPLLALAAGTKKPVPPVSPVSFRLDVMPVFFRAGCNSGGCHGAAAGKDGFHLSLFGYDPQGDYYRLTRQMIGRRIDLAAPAQSLLLLKSTGQVPHSGGRRFAPSSDLYNTVLHWIEQGARDDAASAPQISGISLLPAKLIFSGKETKRPLQVLANYTDGSTRDVTGLALYLTNNKATAAIDSSGLVTAGKRGDTNVFARFAKYTVGAEVIVLPREKFKWPKVTAANYIDELVFSKLQKLHITPSDLAPDDEFLRRIYLDLTGLPPTPEDYERFNRDRAPSKRAQLIDELMARDEFADLWAARWAETLKLTSDGNDASGTGLKSIYSYYQWIRAQMRRNTPLDQFARAQIIASGSTFENPEANFYTMLPQGAYDPKAMAQDVTQVFTGMRIQCAQCHNHPFDHWTQDDYYSFVSFFTGIKRKFGSDPRELYIFNDPGAPPAKHLLDGRPMPPRFLGDLQDLKPSKDYRPALAAWLTSKDNPLFRENMANRIWAHFMGRGIVDPVDDVRVSNPPANPELLQELGSRLASYNFDARRLMRDICQSRAYQLSSTPNPSNRDDETQFSHARLRRLRADVLLDSIDLVTATKSNFGNYPSGLRAVQLYEGTRRSGDYFLKTFGLAARDSVNASETRLEPTLAQALHLINGDTLEGKLSRSKIVAGMLREKKKPAEIIDALYLRSLTRPPSLDEKQKLLALATGREADRKVYDDIFWALLNSTEFAFNH